MTSFYNKYYLSNGNSTDTNTNVLKKDYTLDYTDYEKLKINEQYNKLYSNIYEKNQIACIELAKQFAMNSDLFKLYYDTYYARSVRFCEEFHISMKRKV